MVQQADVPVPLGSETRPQINGRPVGGADAPGASPAFCPARVCAIHRAAHGAATRLCRRQRDQPPAPRSLLASHRRASGDTPRIPFPICLASARLLAISESLEISSKPLPMSAAAPTSAPTRRRFSPGWGAWNTPLRRADSRASTRCAPRSSRCWPNRWPDVSWPGPSPTPGRSKRTSRKPGSSSTGPLYEQKTFKYHAWSFGELRDKLAPVRSDPDLAAVLDRTGCAPYLDAEFSAS